jgi:hypothetical protein
MMATAYFLIENDTNFPEERIVAESAKLVTMQIEMIKGQTSQKLFGEASQKFFDAANDFSSVALKMCDQHADDSTFSKEEKQLYGNLLRLGNNARYIKVNIDKLDIAGPSAADTALEDKAIEFVMAGQIATNNAEIRWPISFLRKLGPGASYKASIAANLSLLHWKEKDSYSQN